MLEEKDIKQIGEEMGKIIEDNINPQFESVYGQLSEIKGRLDKIETTMVTKSYLDDKLADLEGNLISKLRKEDEKLNRLIEILQNKSVLSSEDTKQFQEFQIFPKTK